MAVLEGPNGIWRAKRGDAVPGVGRVESIVRWGNYWVVATSNGLIAPRDKARSIEMLEFFGFVYSRIATSVGGTSLGAGGNVIVIDVVVITEGAEVDSLSFGEHSEGG